MTEPDPTMTRIGRGIELSQQGEREAARAVFAEVWSDIGGEVGDPFHRCALAHSRPMSRMTFRTSWSGTGVHWRPRT